MEGVSHPLLLLAAIVAVFPFVPSVARSFFGSRDQFAEDLGTTTPDGRWALLMDYFGVNYRYGAAGLRPIFLNIIWFFVIWTSLVAAAYHLLVFLAT